MVVAGVELVVQVRGDFFGVVEFLGAAGPEAGEGVGGGDEERGFEGPVVGEEGGDLEGGDGGGWGEEGGR